MIAIFLFTWLLVAFHVAAAYPVWNWFGQHVILTILLLIFLA